MGMLAGPGPVAGAAHAADAAARRLGRRQRRHRASGVEAILRRCSSRAAAALVLFAAWRLLPRLLAQASAHRLARGVPRRRRARRRCGSAFLSDRVGSVAGARRVPRRPDAGRLRRQLAGRRRRAAVPRHAVERVLPVDRHAVRSRRHGARTPAWRSAMTLGIIVHQARRRDRWRRASRASRGPVALAAAFGLAHVGEFSFVLGAERPRGAASCPATGGRCSWAARCSRCCSARSSAAPRSRCVGGVLLARRGERRPATRSRRRSPPRRPRAALQHHVVIAGFGLNGRNVARVLRAVRIPHVVRRPGPRQDRRAAVRWAAPALLGNATQPEILERAGVDRARALVVALSDPIATRHATRLARAAQPRPAHRGAHPLRPRDRRASTTWGPTGDPGGVRDLDRDLHRRAAAVPRAAQHRRRPGRRCCAASATRCCAGRSCPGSVVEQLDEILAEGTTETARDAAALAGRRHARSSELGLDPVSDGSRVVAVVRGGQRGHRISTPASCSERATRSC